MGTTNQIELSLFLIICGILGMLLLAVGISVFVLMYQKRMIQQEHQLQSLKLEYQKQLLSHVIKAEESERQRIAKDLHDGVGGMLSASKLYLHHLFLAKQDNAKAGLYQEVKDIIDEALTNIRFISRDLIPPSLEKLGVIASLKTLVDRVNQSDDLVIEFTYQNEKRFEVQKELAIYRISQELIQNTLKYAQATTIKLDFHFFENGLRYTYQDDGIGFDYEAKRAVGLGMKNIESRALFLNAKSTYDIAPNKGVKIILQFKP